MVKHNLELKYFHGCNNCRDCCNGKLFSMGDVTYSDFTNIIKLFPTAFNIKTKKMVFFYSLFPFLGCHYFRDGNCTIYETIDRPNTCINYPFGIDSNHTIQYDPIHCPELNDNISKTPTIINNEINPDIMNNFFTEKQYLSNINNHDKILDDFTKMVFETESLLDFPTFKTLDGDIININELEANRDMKILDTDNFLKILKRQKLEMYSRFVYGHLFSLDNLPQFGTRLLEQLK